MKKLFTYNFCSPGKLTIVTPIHTGNRKIIAGDRIRFKKILLLAIFINLGVHTFAQTVNITTTAATPASPILMQYLNSGMVRCTVTYTRGLNDSVTRRAFIFGMIQSVSSDLTITTRISQQASSLTSGIPVNIMGPGILNSFGNLSPNNISITGQGAFNMTPPNITLPDGVYRICFYAGNENDCTTANPNNCLLSTLNGCNTFTVACAPVNGAFINTIVTPPANPIIDQTILAGGVNSTIQFNVPAGCGRSLIKLYGKIESVSPLFTITPNANYIPAQTIILNPGTVNQVSISQQRDALANFDATKLVASGIDLASITDVNGRIRLPDGTYHICYYARYFDSAAAGNTASNPNLGCGNFTINCAPANGVQINTIVKPQTNPVISQAISTGGITSSLQINNQPQCNTQVKLFGKIERISPSPFSISLNPAYQQQAAIPLNPGVPIQLGIAQQLDAFGKFQESNLVAEGIDLASIRDANNNIKLPDGNYRICFYARYINVDGTISGNASDPNLGCGTFSICYQAGGAPQFTQPISNLNINSEISVVQPASPVIFTWTPPQSTCGLPAGGYTYDFEIRELFPNQNVTDALNNPFVFRKTSLPSTTFLLDTNLNRNVLHEGRRYAIRVRAVSTTPNSPVEIDNNGFSRIEAFQYGGNIITHNGVPHEPEDYYIPFIERRSDFWDNVYSSYRNHTRGDTLVPVKEYIAFALTQNLTAYNLDAIELFLALNPELAELKKVKISYAPKFPEFPLLQANDRNNFDKEHEINLEPDKPETNKFLKYLDTLNNIRQKIPDNAAKMISDLVTHLNGIKTQVDSIDRVSVNLINMVLSELLYELHRSPQGLNRNQLNQLQGLVSTLSDLTAPSPNATSFFYRFPGDKRSSLSSYQSNTSRNTQKVSFINNVPEIDNDSPDHLLSTLIKQLLPFDVVVYRYSKETPAKPVLDAPDLSKTYRIFYALQTLYNHKSPEVNAKSATHLASTVQVSLPSNTVFTFWALNMLTHRNTKPEDIDLKGVLSQTNKILPGLKKPSIVLKVD